MNKKIIQVLDIYKNCKGIYADDRFVLEPSESILSNFSLTWKHSQILDDEKYKYLYLLTSGKPLGEYSSQPDTFRECQKRLEAHRNAASIAKVSLEEECFFDVIPKHQLCKWFELRQQALSRLSEEYKFGDDYDILHKAHVLTSTISRQDIKFGNSTGRVVYDIFGSATGRLTTKKGSVPVLTLKKDQRNLLEPQNDAFVELDLNAAEIRMLLALMGKEQPSGDIHEWLAENIFSGEVSRSEIKVKVFSWLYNFSAPKSRLDQIFSREIFRDFYLFEENSLTTPFGRRLAVDERRAQNYLLQSATSDQVIENAYKIQKILKDRKSNVAFTLHDSIVLDMSREDAIILEDIKKCFENTRWGNFVSTCKIGKDFGSLKEMDI